MISFAHIINPVPAQEESDLHAAQPITFETMRTARKFARRHVNTKLYAVQIKNEKKVNVPDDFIVLPDLTRTIADLKSFKHKKNLPLIKDILDALYFAGEADYLIYTNTDIALQPFFYQTVSSVIASGYDAFVVNRRTIPEHYRNPEDIPLMCAEIGEPHPGYDCFIFKREIFPRFQLGAICIGTAWVGRALLANMLAYSRNFKEFRDAHLTFHIGNSLEWRREEYADYLQENYREYLAIIKKLESERGTFNPVLRSYLLDTGNHRTIPDFDVSAHRSEDTCRICAMLKRYKRKNKID